MSPGLAADLLLGVLIVAVAGCAVVVRQTFAAVVLFIIYGVLVALAWVRLSAIDVALAEAAIGAGLTGLLLVGAAARLPAGAGNGFGGNRLRRRLVRCAQGGLGLLVSGAILWVVLTVPRGPGLGVQVASELAATGLGNPVTAVLLQFRGYDTLLEAVVLLAALVAVWSLTRDDCWAGRPGLRQHARPEGVLASFGRVLPVIGLLVGLHLLWAGADAPGGAFQAGTVLAAVWLLGAMAGLVQVPAISHPALLGLACLGPVAFTLFALGGAAVGIPLGYPAGSARTWTLLIEVALTLSIAATLGLLVLGVPRRSS